MNICYELFERLYLPHAKVLSTSSGNANIADELCRYVYREFDGQELPQPREIYLRLAEVFYSQFYKEEMPPALAIVTRIFRKELPLSNDDIVSLDDALNLLEPIMLDMPLIDRAITALCLLGWPNSAITKVLNHAIDKISFEIVNVNTLQNVARALSKFRKHLTFKINGDNNCEWLKGLFLYKDKPLFEMKTWQMVSELHHMSEEYRFARNDILDKFGRLRDRWKCGRKLICNRLRQKQFYYSKQEA